MGLFRLRSVNDCKGSKNYHTITNLVNKSL
nr:MAG TPA: hypothetical protein [Caudoviricetes sp.]